MRLRRALEAAIRHRPSSKRARPTPTPWLAETPVRASWFPDAAVVEDDDEPADDPGVDDDAPPVVGVEPTVVGVVPAVVVVVAASTVIVPCIMAKPWMAQ